MFRTQACSSCARESVRTQLSLRCGTWTRIRLIDINKICAAVGTDVCKALIGMHTFTGCDTVSAFAGKIRVLEILKKNSNVRDKKQLKERVCLLHTPKTAPTDISILRYILFRARKGEIESH